ncbi:ABC transporter ATP-binding protein [Brevibacterium yomogidense]|uniref:ABC transporter ATP-binding protein n=1 Tax=Brevibacterium yomogidense TaxID=946573 RepID=UPI0018E0195D|nr:ABC transporter ATP-binding protein [Brevibacterium yomogidense]
MSEKKPPLLEVDDLSVTFSQRGRDPVEAVSEVSFTIGEGENVGIVGESGSGKSVTSMALMGLLPERGVTVGGSARYQGKDLLRMSRRELNRIRGTEIAMVFQDPMSSLNPVVTIGTQISEVIKRHNRVTSKQAADRSAELLDRVGIPDPRRRLSEYPHQLSGGIRQRVLIAIALACEPKLLIADEPTTALDVTIQAQILTQLRELVADFGTSLIMITHDLGVVAGLCDEVHVMYAGRIVESADRRPLFAQPRHPYTGGLLQSVPRLDSPRDEPLEPIPGSPTDTLPWSEGCAFQPRCSNAVDQCLQQTPRLEPDDGRLLRCFNPLEGGGRDR